MEDAAILEKLTDLFREFFANDEIALTPQTTARDIESWDSFNHISLMVAVETRFAIKLQTAEIERMTNVGDLIRTIRARA